MQSMQTYLRIWLKADTLALSHIDSFKKLNLHSPVLNFTLLVLESGDLSDFGLRRARFLFDLCRPEPATQEQLQLFLILHEVRSAQGHIRTTLPDDSLTTIFNNCLLNLKSKSNYTPAESTRVFIQQLERDEPKSKGIIHRLQQILKDPQPYLNQGDFSPFSSYVTESKTHWYFKKMLYAEQTVTRILGERFKQDEDKINQPHLKAILSEILDAYTLRKGPSESSRYYMNYRQQAAVALACYKPALVITGGPGTGKTSVVVQILRALNRIDPSLKYATALCAPTGRAAARLQESIASSLEGLQYYQTTEDTFRDNLAEDAKLARISGSTVHRLLQYNPGNGHFKHTKNNLLPLKLLVVDEVSMLDIHLFAALLEALPKDCRILLLGDRNQLPSVESGAVLGDLTNLFYSGNFCSLSAKEELRIQSLIPAPSNQDAMTTPRSHVLRDHLVVLTESHRSELSILELAQYINTEDIEACFKTLIDNTYSISADMEWPIPIPNEHNKLRCMPSGIRHYNLNNDDLEILLKSWVHAHYTGLNNPFNEVTELNSLQSALDLFAKLFSKDQDPIVHADSPLYVVCERLQKSLSECRILCLTREGMRGSREINRKVSKLCVPHFDPEYSQSKVFHGLPIMISRNARHLNLYNGDVGVFVRVEQKFFALFKQSEFYELIPIHRLPEWEPAFAMTVHKSQGSEYDHLLLILPEYISRLLSREILYTAITRARYFAGILGDARLFAESVNKRIERDSGIPEYFDQLS